ncbi:MAG: Flp pilus assembly complex ATPase component TadA [Proteobacteria bacterium]|nr:type II secretion system protein GspE [Desulfobulbaceae bacterium]MBU4153926.1 Flp pilus assembly complex ATPase component TadA [Pseudomonadota bacterium]
MLNTVFFKKKNKIGELLISKGKITKGEMERALAHMETVDQGLGEILISLGFISELDLVETLAEQVEIEVYKPDPIDEVQPLEISKLFHREHPFAVLKRADKLFLVVNNPLDGDVLSTVELLFVEPFEVQITTESVLRTIVHEHYGLSIDEGADDDPIGREESDIDKLKDMASEAPVIKYVNNLIDTAVKRRASDIHMEPFDEGFYIRLRIDGILHEYEITPKAMQAAIVSRTKLLAALDIAERRLPQDGKISIRISGKELDLRVSTMPTVYGEGVVIRILEKGNIILDMHQLGMPQKMEKSFKRMITIPDGIVLVTGPTGSGKTTTLYCALNYINSGTNKIITLEDPVEYQLRGINQIQVRPEIKLTFAKGLRSIVRQDPDVIMVGEIRDLETAEIAVQSSLTGHLVFSTLHTNDAISAVARMIDMGVERFLISSSLRAILAQRLVRCICKECKQPKGMISEFLPSRSKDDDFTMYKGRGCDACSGTGFTGRIGVYELLVITDAIGKGISQGLDLLDLKRIADSEGFFTMYHDGLEKVKAGVTTYSEVMRVTRSLMHELV